MAERQALLSGGSNIGAAVAFSALALAGEAAWALTSALGRLADGSIIMVHTDKPSYNAGEVMTGKVIVYATNAIQCQAVALKIKVKESSEWDVETSHTHFEKNNEGQDVPVTTWSHDTKKGKKNLFKEVVVVSQIPHILPPGSYSYPFSFPIPASLPGVAKFKKVRDASDPHWRKAGKQLTTKASVVFSVKAVLQAGGGFFHRDLKSVQEIPVNPAFDWSKMVPATCSEAKRIVVCCCFDKGPVSVNVVANKAAFQSGETALVTATFKNDSTAQFRSVISRLYRTVIVEDGKGHRTSHTDTVCEARFPGVAPGETVVREMPLRLASSHGPLQASISSSLLTIKYVLDIVGDVAWSSDLEARIPVLIYEPSPAVPSYQAFGATLPPAVVSLLGSGVPPMASAPAMPAPGGAAGMPMSPGIATVPMAMSPGGPMPSAPPPAM